MSPETTAPTIPGLEALFLARANHEIETTRALELDRQERIRKAREYRKELAALLFLCGIEGITEDACAIGRWEAEDSATWCYHGAAITGSNDRLYVYDDAFGDWDIPEIGRVFIRFDDEDAVLDSCLVDLLGLIEIAHRRFTARQAQSAAAPAPAPAPSPSPYIIDRFDGFTVNLQYWVNDRYAEGYDHLQLIPSGGDVIAVMRRDTSTIEVRP